MSYQDINPECQIRYGVRQNARKYAPRAIEQQIIDNTSKEAHKPKVMFSSKQENRCAEW